MKTVTVSDIRALRPCGSYDEERLKKLFGRKKKATLEQVLDCKQVPVQDRLWVATRGPWLDDRRRRLFAADCAERALPNWYRYYPADHRVRDTIAISRRYAVGEATGDELLAARLAAWSARSAARSAAESAAESACSAEWLAAWSAAESAAESACSAAGKAEGTAEGTAEEFDFCRWAFARLIEYAENKI